MCLALENTVSCVDLKPEMPVSGSREASDTWHVPVQPSYLQTGAGMCLAVENAVSCADQQRPGLPVCAWRNVLLQPCVPTSDTGSLDQVWVLEEGTRAMMALGSFQVADSICLEACTDRNYGHGACSMVDDNVGEALACVMLPACSRVLLSYNVPPLSLCFTCKVCSGSQLACVAARSCARASALELRGIQHGRLGGMHGLSGAAVEAAGRPAGQRWHRLHAARSTSALLTAWRSCHDEYVH